MTLTIGWWAIPLTITILAFGFALIKTGKSSGPHCADSIGDAISFCIFNGAALIISLIAWLIWALAV